MIKTHTAVRSALVVLLSIVGAARLPAQEPLDAIYGRLAAARTQNLARLHTYTQCGRFPRNTYVPTQRTPFFVDDAGTRCAVGELMWHAGARPAVRAIAAADNHVKVMDVRSGPLVDWVLASGLTQEECAQVQPTYEFYFYRHDKERRRIQAHLTAVEARLRARTAASLAVALRRYLDHEIEVGKLTAAHRDVLLQALRDKEPAVRIGAAHAIGRLKLAAQTELTALLRDPDREVRLFGAVALLRTLPPPVDPRPYREILAPLTEVLQNGTDDQRLSALLRIGLLACGAQTLPGDRAILHEIRAAVAKTEKHPSADVRHVTGWMKSVCGPVSRDMNGAASYNTGRIFIELLGGNPLHAAALQPHDAELRALLKDDPKLLDRPNQFGQTPLHLAAAQPSWTQATALLALHANLAARTATGRIPLHGAAMDNVGGDVTARDGVYQWTPLHYALLLHPWMVRKLLDSKAPLDAQDKFGFTPLHIAVGCQTPGEDPVTFSHPGSWAVIRWLLRAGADASIRDKTGRTPLDWAKQLKNIKAIEALTNPPAKRGPARRGA
ncbi:MAG: HEAT repeat domain-containing protein [Planctomycetes bacterium]|nr:HEAT repeat domain-containing protein [Planctomycetota bacterium]